MFAALGALGGINSNNGQAMRTPFGFALNKKLIAGVDCVPALRALGKDCCRKGDDEQQSAKDPPLKKTQALASGDHGRDETQYDSHANR